MNKVWMWQEVKMLIMKLKQKSILENSRTANRTCINKNISMNGKLFKSVTLLVKLYYTNSPIQKVLLCVLLLTACPISQAHYSRCRVVGQGAAAWQNTCLWNRYKRQQLFITFCNCVWLWKQKTDKSIAADLRLRLPFPAIWIINRSIS